MTIETDPRLTQVHARDAAADGSFVYAVQTTGVFCKPSCPARAARAENIAFFATAGEAAAAGYRACKRCRPTGDPIAAEMIDIAVFIREHADEPLPLAMLAARASLSPSHFQRRFTAAIGVSPKAYHANERLRGFKAGLRAGEPVLGALFDAGYGSTSRAYAQVDGGLGMTPSAYRAGGRGETLHYAVRETALGPLLMAATERGIAAVHFGDDAGTLVAQLQHEFAHARLVAAPDSGSLDDWMTALDAHLSRGGPRPDLPVDLRGTAFQLRVWRFLLGVAPGDVVSYTEVAAGIGAPAAVRAAASACAANRIAVLIPCHRVLRGDGGLGGYRWGVPRKRALLDLEHAARR